MNSPEWNLVRIGERDNPALYRELTPEQETRQRDYAEALGVAMVSQVTDPIFSHYHVKEGVGPLGGSKEPAGNREYGHLQGLHGEEFAVAVFTRAYPNHEGPVVLGLIAGEEGNLATPCGNCRDILFSLDRDNPENIEIVSGAETGGLAVVANLGDYLFDDFKPAETLKGETGRLTLGRVMHNAGVAVELMEMRHTQPVYDMPFPYDAYSPEEYPFPAQIYTAGVVNRTGYMYVGEHRTNAHYHPTYAVENAIARADRDYGFGHLVIVTKDPSGGPPQVMYRDRQFAYDHSLRQRDVTDTEYDPVVLLVNIAEPRDMRVWYTSVREWLPLPFSSDNFDEATRANIKAYHKQHADLRIRR